MGLILVYRRALLFLGPQKSRVFSENKNTGIP